MKLGVSVGLLAEGMGAASDSAACFGCLFLLQLDSDVWWISLGGLTLKGKGGLGEEGEGWGGGRGVKRRGGKGSCSHDVIYENKLVKQKSKVTKVQFIFLICK